MESKVEIVGNTGEDFYNRVTRTPQTQIAGFDNLKDGAIHRLFKLLYPKEIPQAFDPKDEQQVQFYIKQFQALKERVKEQSQKDKIDKRLQILRDLNKINQLSLLDIPKDANTTLSYCVLKEATAGVTEKIPLMPLANVINQLNRLSSSPDLTVDSYNANRNAYKLSTQAILKLPKHNSVTEVQHESIALGLSRMMNLSTTQSLMVMHDGKPALLVPFDNITLLNEFAEGTTETAWLTTTWSKYTDNSTIKPLGEGLQADCYVEDFGKAFGLMYVCNDPDAIGGYNQNKALLDARELYIFDQVVKLGSDSLQLDSRLCLQATLVSEQSRHLSGRNKSLIEDSSMATKFQSLIQLRELDSKMDKYIYDLELKHQNYKQQLPNNPQNKKALEQLALLIQDGLEVHKAIKARVGKINAILPKTKGNVGNDLVLHSLILQKLLHKPVLFTQDGRPYKYPNGKTPTNPVESIQEVDADNVQIVFKDYIPTDVLQALKSMGYLQSMTSLRINSFVISRKDLLALEEHALYPESKLTLQSINYLSPQQLSFIHSAYAVDYEGSKLSLQINHYQQVMASDKPLADKLQAIVDIEKLVVAYVQNSDNKGWGKHVLKKLQFDIQNRLQKLMPQVPAQLTNAFIAALKLDKVAQFNQVVLNAVKNNRVKDPEFLAFLDECMRLETRATNYKEAQVQSRQISEYIDKIQLHLQKPYNPMQALSRKNSTDLFDFDPVADMNRGLKIMSDKFITALTQSPVPRAQTLFNDEPDEDQTISHSIK